MDDQEGVLLRRAIRLACENVSAGGGPFGAVVAKGGRMLAEGANRVVPDADPTAHAEVVAIRAAARALGTHDLSGAVLYASCEPCPMCLAAAWWARIGRIVFAATRAEAAAAGFDDAAIYEEVAAPLSARRLPIVQALPEAAAEPFRLWAQKADRVPY
ncbi:MAG: nucleoside deaminase [Acetobacteraceae bacterium]|nr:nucleoside deaminase [Acetobacteraceae bacterium]